MRERLLLLFPAIGLSVGCGGFIQATKGATWEQALLCGVVLFGVAAILWALN